MTPEQKQKAIEKLAHLTTEIEDFASEETLKLKDKIVEKVKIVIAENNLSIQESMALISYAHMAQLPTLLHTMYSVSISTAIVQQRRVTAVEVMSETKRMIFNIISNARPYLTKLIETTKPDTFAADFFAKLDLKYKQ